MKEIVVKRARFAFLNAGFYDAAELVHCELVFETLTNQARQMAL